MPLDGGSLYNYVAPEVVITELADSVCLARNPLVSVTMTTYNHAPWIAQAIEGVVTQKCSFPFELIIGDDCSTDGTTGICKEYQKRYPHLIRLVIVDCNTGSKQNLRRQIERIRGDFHALCDGDDYWCDPEKLERQIAMLRKHPECSLAFAWTRVHNLADNGANLELSDLIGPRKSKSLFSPREFFKDEYLAHTSSLLFRRIATYPDEYWKPMALGDQWIFLLCMECGAAVFVDRVMSVYRATGKGMWTSLHNLEKDKAVRDTTVDMLRYSRKRKLPFAGVIEKRVLMAEIRLVRNLRRAQRMVAARKECRELFKTCRVWMFPSQWRRFRKELIRSFRPSVKISLRRIFTSRKKSNLKS